jgi:hypothetical protein
MSNNPILITKNNEVIYASYEAEKIFGYYSFLLKGKLLGDLIKKSSLDKIQKANNNEIVKMRMLSCNSKEYDVQIAKAKFDNNEILIIYFDAPKTINKEKNNINIDNKTLFEHFINSSKLEISESIADIAIDSNCENKINNLNNKMREFYSELIDFFRTNEENNFEIFNIEPIIKDVIDIINAKSGYKSNITLVNSLENGNVYGNKIKFIELINTAISNYVSTDSLNIKMIEEDANATIIITYLNDKNTFTDECLKRNEALVSIAEEAGAKVFNYFDVHKGCKTVISYNLSRAYRLYEY